MSDAARTYRIFGSELSPYSVKVRSYFRYKKIPHQWIERSQDDMAEFQKYAKLPLIPLVVTPDGTGLQDSTPIIERLENLFPEPSIHPQDANLRFLSALIEEYADEWGNKPMFHYRWTYEQDQWSAASRIAASNLPDASEEEQEKVAEMIRDRMVPRLSFVGSSLETKDQIEGSFLRQLSILEPHLETRDFLFGGRPAFADFGMFAQLYEASTDPTPGELMKREYPNVMAWIERMLEPGDGSDFEKWEALAPTLMPLLRDEVGAVFLPWSDANAKALAAGEEEFTVELAGEAFTQNVQKYHARSLAKLRERFEPLRERKALRRILDEAGCLAYLQSAA